MKQSHFLPLIVLSLVLASCSTYQYTARQTEVRQRPIDAKEQLNSITVNYDKQVTATSDYQMTKKDAIAEAEFRCIEDEKIDVVVDPIFKVEYNPFKFKRRFKATIVGFAGKYKEEPNRLDDSKKYTLEEIEKFKLLYDANFPQYYYQKSNEGDRYFFNSGAPKLNENPKSSILLPKNSMSPRAYLPNQTYDLKKSKAIRNAGICCMVGGAVLCVGIGVPMLVRAQTDGAVGAGIAFMCIGAVSAVYAGIPLLTVGQIRVDRAKRTEYKDITLNSGTNGIGLGFTL